MIRQIHHFNLDKQEHAKNCRLEVFLLLNRHPLHISFTTSSQSIQHCRGVTSLLWNDIELSWKLHLPEHLFRIFTYKYGIVVTF